MAAPFVSYLTVFKSRLGIAHLVLPATGFVHVPREALERKLRQRLAERSVVALGEAGQSQAVLEYLLEKRLVGAAPRKRGRYAGYVLERSGETLVARDADGTAIQEFPVYMTDVWLADPDVRSTIGVPTPDNAGEVLEFAFDLQLLSRAKNTWTAAAQLIAGLRAESKGGSGANANPFLLELESPALLRQVLQADGLVSRELLRTVAEFAPGALVRRDAVAEQFADIVGRAVAAGKALRLPPPESQALRGLYDLVRKRAKGGQSGKGARLAGSAKPSGGPGVLEHRVSPRLEWLTDLGYLSKDGIPKNSFEYRVGGELKELLYSVDEAFGSDDGPETVAVSQWRRNPAWESLRPRIPESSFAQNVARAYGMMHRRIGPAPLREVAFATALRVPLEKSYSSVLEDVIAFANETEGATLSGGRYRRTPENIYLPESVWAHGGR